MYEYMLEYIYRVSLKRNLSQIEVTAIEGHPLANIDVYKIKGDQAIYFIYLYIYLSSRKHISEEYEN